MIIKNLMRQIPHLAIEFLYRRPKIIFDLKNHKEYYAGKSYYPDLPSRPVWKNYLYQVNQIWKYGAPNKYFFMYGLDVKTRDEQREYVNFIQAFNRVANLNIGKNMHNSTCILRNKLYFDIFANGIGIKTPKIQAYYTHGKLYIWKEGFVESPFNEISNLKVTKLFCKEIEGECGMGIFILKIELGKMYIDEKEITATDLEYKIKGADYLFQEVVVQHEEMQRLYPNSINTMRLITVRSIKDDKYHVLPSILRIGANGNFVDNTSQGGIAVGFDLHSGRLHEYGFQKPQFGLRSNQHPDTGVRFADFTIPYFDRAIEAAIHFHSMLKDIQSVGWDIAIGPDGPIFIEGNDNWEINGPQVGNHGLRKEFEEYFF